MPVSALLAAGMLSIGDSLHTGNKPLRFPGIPSFSPEKFAYIQNPNPSKYKNFRVRPSQQDTCPLPSCRASPNPAGSTVYKTILLTSVWGC